LRGTQGFRASATLQTLRTLGPGRAPSRTEHPGPSQRPPSNSSCSGGWHCGASQEVEWPFLRSNPRPRSRRGRAPPTGNPARPDIPAPASDPPRTAAVRGMALRETQGFRASATSTGAGARPPPETPPSQTSRTRPATPLEQQLFGGWHCGGLRDSGRQPRSRRSAPSAREERQAEQNIPDPASDPPRTAAVRGDGIAGHPRK